MDRLQQPTPLENLEAKEITVEGTDATLQGGVTREEKTYESKMN